MERAESEELESVCVNQVSAATGDLADDRLKAGVLDLDGSAAGAADDVVVVLLRLARHIRVLPRRQVESLERAKLGEQLEVAENSRPTKTKTLAAGV